MGIATRGEQGEAFMGQYLSIESRDPFDSGNTQNFYDLAAGLAKDGQ